MRKYRAGMILAFLGFFGCSLGHSYLLVKGEYAGESLENLDDKAEKKVQAGGGSMSKELKVKLKTSDDCCILSDPNVVRAASLFEVEEVVAFESQTIKDMVEDTGTESVIPLLNVSSKILSKVIEYCRYHALEVPKSADDKPALSEEDVKHWDAEFVKVDHATLFDLFLAANYLKIKNLLDLTTQSIGDMMKGKTPEEIRKTFNIVNDFTTEEEEEVRRENQWAFE